MTRYMLDTNAISYFTRGNDNVQRAILARDYSELCISSIVEAELLYGIRLVEIHLELITAEQR